MFQIIMDSSQSTSSITSILHSIPNHKPTINGHPVQPTLQLDSIEEALEAFAKGECLVVVDDLDRENEGDLIVAAQNVSTETMAFIIRHSSGYVCIAMTGSRLEELSIPMMVEQNEDRHRTAYAVTVDYRNGTTTGISAHDRALTARSLASNKSIAKDFSRPGHLVPLRASDGGVLRRRGHTEAAIELCLLTHQFPAGVLCELVKPDSPQGDMARRDDCYQFSRHYGLKMISIEDLESFIKRKRNFS